MGTSAVSLVYITCVDPKRGHPSGRLAEKYREFGADVVTAFENARDLFSIFRDAIGLWRHVSNRKFDSAILNLNGSVAQLVAIFVLRCRGIPTSIWIMDSYPGCLRYVSRFWWVFWPIFYIAAWIVKGSARAVFIIDEGFREHAPRSSTAAARTHYIPLPVPLPSSPLRARSQLEKPLVIGILGKIEQGWLDQRFASIAEVMRERGFRILIATSDDVRFPGKLSENCEVIRPWPKEETDKVFQQCDYLLVPLSAARMTYSSPSKIVESYSRGLQPIIDSDYLIWNQNKHRLVYQRCIHVNDFLAVERVYNIEELKKFASNWAGQWENVIEKTIRLSSSFPGKSLS